MNSEKLLGLVKRWRLLEAQQKDLDYNKAQWAREARGCFIDDRRFIVWCKSDLGLKDSAAQDLCLMARAAGIVPDAKTWSQLGGSKQIRVVEDLTKRQQVSVIKNAKTSGRAIRTIVKEMFPDTSVPSETEEPNQDALVLAEFIFVSGTKMTKSVEKIVMRYAKFIRGLSKAA